MDHSYPVEIERLMEHKGYVKQRGSGVSINALAAAAGVHVDTVKTILLGDRSSRPRSVSAVADALGISSSRLSELAGRGGGEVYVGPDVTRYMSERQREALTDFLLATMEERQVGHNVRDTSNAQAAGSAATAADAAVPVTHLFGSGRRLHADEDTEDDQELAASPENEGVPRRQGDDDSA